MGWIRKVFRRISIPAAFIICGLSCLLAALALTKATMWFARKNMNEIESEYQMQLALDPDILYDDALLGIGTIQNEMELQPSASVKVYHDADWEFAPLQGQIQYSVSSVDLEQESYAKVVLINTDAFQETDQKKYDFFEGLDSTASILWYSVCLCIAAVIFYLWKIKKPFSILNQAVRKISENDLNYRINYNGQDEFGRLCHAFEVMRQELVHNNQKMWNSVEERKRLNAAFAHDLRTPLTVLRGHVDMLNGALSDNTADRELAYSVNAISQQITRLNAYVDTMGTLQRLEDYEPCPGRISPSALSEMVSETAALLFPNGKIEVYTELREGDMLLDREAFAQICENILSNAARYARERIVVSLRQKEKELILCVEDDGAGFSEKDLANASLAYYRGEKTEAGTVTHFGLGLYICNLLAEKLGGNLHLSNSTDGGGRVTFKCPCGHG